MMATLAIRPIEWIRRLPFEAAARAANWDYGIQ